MSGRLLLPVGDGRKVSEVGCYMEGLRTRLWSMISAITAILPEYGPDLSRTTVKHHFFFKIHETVVSECDVRRPTSTKRLKVDSCTKIKIKTGEQSHSLQNAPHVMHPNQSRGSNSDQHQPSHPTCIRPIQPNSIHPALIPATIAHPARYKS